MSVPCAARLARPRCSSNDYFGVNADVVWGVVHKELPELKRKVEELLQALG